MAYLAFHDLDGATVAPHAPAEASGPAAGVDRLSAFEWSVVAIARRDRLASLRRPGRIATVLDTVFRKYNPRLANERLEALRRVAVAVWHDGGTVPLDARRRLLDAGFTPGQFEALIAGIHTAAARDSDARDTRPLPSLAN